jgi:hypothetical protein
MSLIRDILERVDVSSPQELTPEHLVELPPEMVEWLEAGESLIDSSRVPCVVASTIKMTLFGIRGGRQGSRDDRCLVIAAI